MSNMDVLNKLTLGTENTEKITINFKDEEHEFELRPLTDGELIKIQTIEKKPYNMKIEVDANGKRKSVQKPKTTDMELSMGEFTQYQSEAMYTAIAWSMSITDEVPVEVIKSLPKGLPQLIFQEVIRISSLTESDLTSIKSFQ